MTQLQVDDKNYPMVFDMGAWADLEEAGFDPQDMLKEITAEGKTFPLVFLTWIMIRAAAKNPESVEIETVRHFPLTVRPAMIRACVRAFAEGMHMEIKDLDGGVRDLGLEEAAKKEVPDA